MADVLMSAITFPFVRVRDFISVILTFLASLPRTPDQLSLPGNPNCKTSVDTVMSYLLGLKTKTTIRNRLREIHFFGQRFQQFFFH
ncbi:Uncharacterized protein APZ42_017470 [Daphnia magna]|uniref:Uncharacterized protein n=1 Tax=Daphnia magna TaxID=35525 RepID=A0A164ZW66_9CRUS|nr:Uncharacterized protein APZ42_017470 [Daphnia magna]